MMEVPVRGKPMTKTSVYHFVQDFRMSGNIASDAEPLRQQLYALSARPNLLVIGEGTRHPNTFSQTINPVPQPFIH